MAMISWWSRFREFDSKGLLVDRVEGDLAFTKRGYVFDRRVFRGYLILVFGVLAFIMWSSSVGLQELYLVCDNFGQPCVNPFFHACDRVECMGIVDRELLPSGFVLGRPPSEEFVRDVRVFLLVIVGGFVLSVLVNHYLRNRGKGLGSIVDLEGFS